MLKYLSFFALSICASVAHAEEKAASLPWKLGISFQQLVYTETSLNLALPSSSTGQLVLSVGSQSYPASHTDQSPLRKSVGYMASWASGLNVVGMLDFHNALSVGLQTYHGNEKSFPFLDLANGFGVTTGKIQMFTDIGYRANLLSSRSVKFGTKKVESSYVYPKLGFNYLF